MYKKYSNLYYKMKIDTKQQLKLRQSIANPCTSRDPHTITLGNIYVLPENISMTLI